MARLSAVSNADLPLADVVFAYGCPEVVSLSGAKAKSPAQIPYLDLLSKQVRETAALLPDAVAEFQGRPVMYFLDGRANDPDPTACLDLQQRLANRGDHAVLAVVRPGDLTLYPLHLDRAQLERDGIRKVIPLVDPTAPFLFHSVATGSLPLEGQSEHADPVFKEIQTLLVRAIEGLVDECQLDGLAVLSMTGRALFFRFLIDRCIVDLSDLDEICPAARKGPGPHDLKAVFSTAERAAQTSAWLDETFNGDLLPLIEDRLATTSPAIRRKAYQDVYSDAGTKSEGEIFRHLEAILRGWRHTRRGTQLRLPIDWDDLNFCHIPVGVLSQVYEDFSHQVNQQDARSRSVHYTPRGLAKLVVEQALAGLDSPHEARILDPSCGAGVFLVLALRELVRLRWAHDIEKFGPDVRRPSKSVIQGILHRQICGFDVSPSALRLAALALYVTVIELNQITRPPSEHHAGRALQDLVLFDQRTASEKTQSGFVLGSLGDAVAARFNDYFDVVVGNPPWTRLKDAAKTQVDAVGTAIARRVLESRGLPKVASKYKNPGGVPDLPFLWRAMEWVKPRGIVGFALDARLMLNQTKTGTVAREALLRSISVTGILNGSDLEKTAVWAAHDQPWILLWARNEKPNLDEHTFQLLTPLRENELANQGEFRLDFQSAYPIPVQKVIQYGWLCKALTMGTTLDVQVMEKLIQTAKTQSVGSFWKQGKKSGKFASGRGIDLEPWKASPAPDWLVKLPVADVEIKRRHQSISLFPPAKTPTFGERYGLKEPHCKYGPDNYRHPLLLIARAPGDDLDRNHAKIFRYRDVDRCFTKNYFGYSGGAHEENQLIIALLQLIAHSSLFQHFMYMFSGQIGAGRRIIDKQDIDAFPFPILEKLSSEDRAQAKALADALDTPGPKDWRAIDAFVCGLFGLTKAEQQVVEDTVRFNGPYQKVREPAALPVPPDEAQEFARTLEKSLQPFFKVTGQKIRAAVVPPIAGEWNQPWRFVTLLLDGDAWQPSSNVIADVMAIATKSSASRIVMALPEGGLILGLINKRRFWTRSRARLCALHISREHLETAFPVPSQP